MKRESNFEVLRTVAMFFIIIHHCLTHGIGNSYSFLTSQPIKLSNALFTDFMLVFSSISVNLYVLISSYFLVDLNFKLSRIIRTWTYACFYSCVITAIFMVLQITIFDLKNLGKSFFPISTDAYWFVTQYLGLLFFSPFWALMVRQLSYRQYIILLIGGALLCLSFFHDFPFGKIYHVDNGYSVWSFTYLFFVAGFIKHHLKKVQMSRLSRIVMFLTILIFVFEIFLGYNKDAIYMYWLSYNGLPFVLSVVVFVMVRQSRVPQNAFWNLLEKIAPYTFGVYLIHDHPLVREWLWTTISMPLLCNYLFFPFIVIGICIVVFVLCVMIDAVKKKLFFIFGIDDLIIKVDKWSFYS